MCAGAQVAVPQSPAPASAAGSPLPTKKMCSVVRDPPAPGETAYNRKEYADAEKLFRQALAANPSDAAAHEGLVRVLLEQDRLAEATSDAEGWLKTSPGDSMAFVALADAQLRGGDPAQAYVTYGNAVLADVCNARAFYGRARVQGLAGLRASWRKSILQAYALHPSDDDIRTAWISQVPLSERLALWSDYAEHSDQISNADRARLRERLAKEAETRGSYCRMSPASPASTNVPMAAITDGPTRFIGWGLDVKFNGQQRRLQIDTGASGIMISRSAARTLGIEREDSRTTGGIGDKDRVKTSIAHVASIRIGDIEFTNCAVEILEKWSVLDDDGLIGADVFANSQVTLDFPKHQLRIAPLPARPADATPKPEKDSIAEVEPELHDPYIAPEMANWARIYRVGHELLIPTFIVQTKQAKDDSAWRRRMFLLDTGSASNLISPEAAREVTKVSRDDWTGIRGIQGAVDKVYEAGSFTLQFTNLRLNSPSMTAIDLTRLSHDTGVEISGLIGAPALFQVVMHIDYRDNLVSFDYTPPK